MAACVTKQKLTCTTFSNHSSLDILYICAEWHVVVSWIAVSATQPTQAATRQPTGILTANISTPRQLWSVDTASQRVVDKRLIRRTAEHAHEARSASSAKDWKLAVFCNAPRKETATLENKVSDSCRSMHETVCNPGSEDDVSSGLELNQIQVKLQTHVRTVLLSRQQEVDA